MRKARRVDYDKVKQAWERIRVECQTKARAKIHNVTPGR